jgi:hypothetical protein
MIPTVEEVMQAALRRWPARDPEATCLAHNLARHYPVDPLTHATYAGLRAVYVKMLVEAQRAQRDAGRAILAIQHLLSQYPEDEADGHNP